MLMRSHTVELDIHTHCVDLAHSYTYSQLVPHVNIISTDVVTYYLVILQTSEQSQTQINNGRLPLVIISRV